MAPICGIMVLLYAVKIVFACLTKFLGGFGHICSQNRSENCKGNVPGHSKRARTCLACRRETDMAAASIFDEGRSRTSER